MTTTNFIEGDRVVVSGWDKRYNPVATLLFVGKTTADVQPTDSHECVTVRLDRLALLPGGAIIETAILTPGPVMKWGNGQLV